MYVCCEVEQDQEVEGMCVVKWSRTKKLKVCVL